MEDKELLARKLYLYYFKTFNLNIYFFPELLIKFIKYGNIIQQFRRSLLPVPFGKPLKFNKYLLASRLQILARVGT